MIVTVTVSMLIEYLRQFGGWEAVVLSADDVEEPGEFVALDVALDDARSMAGADL